MFATSVNIQYHLRLRASQVQAEAPTRVETGDMIQCGLSFIIHQTAHKALRVRSLTDTVKISWGTRRSSTGSPASPIFAMHFFPAQYATSPFVFLGAEMAAVKVAKRSSLVVGFLPR